MANGLFNLKQVMQAVQQGGWTAQRTPSVEYLVVAGGGGGGATNSGGGGAGGLLTGIDPVPNGQTLLVTVGGGGAGSVYSGGWVSDPIAGQNSVFGSITATGGGAGGPRSSGTISEGGSGGSGGGAGTFGVSSGNNVSGQGNAGGFGGDNNKWTGSGGGGAGTVGLNAGTGASAPDNGGNGGAGIASAINGTVTTYAGGGGGGGRYSGGYSTGGVGGGGGGNGGVAPYSGVNGSTNTGGVGGATATGGTGGSGIVIVSYPDVYAAPTATTGSPTVSTSGSGSIAFNGSSQWVTYASNAAWTLGSTFTIEAWVYPTVFSASAKRICQADSGIDLSVNSSGLINFNAATTTTALSLNVWSHVAFVCSSGTSTLYINGVASGFTGTNTGVNVSGTSTLTVGTYQTNSGFAWQGYLSNFRIVKSSAVYTGNFTPSTVPLTAITNTQLLLTSNSGGFLADGSANGFTTTSTTSASPTWNAASPFSVTGYKNRVYTWTSSGSITF